MADLTEKEILARLHESVRQAEDCCRMLGFRRADPRWPRAGKLFADMGEKVAQLATQSVTIN